MKFDPRVENKKGEVKVKVWRKMMPELKFCVLFSYCLNTILKPHSDT